MEAKDLKDWKILNNYSKTDDVKKAYVFGNRVLMLKTDGKIHVKGQNENSILLNFPLHVADVVEATRGCSSLFKDFTPGRNHALAISREGLLFSWGRNFEGQLGRNGVEHEIKQVTNILGTRVAKTACGPEFSFILTTEGKLYEWGIHGFKEISLDWSVKEATSNDHVGESDRTVSSIACMKYYPMVLTKSGKVFIPIFPRTVTCNHCMHQEKLHLFGTSLKNKNVIQILEGRGFGFALTDMGEIYQWKILSDSASDPVQIDVKIGRPIKLWASSSKDIVVATDSYGQHFSLCFSSIGELLSVSSLSFSSPGKYFSYINEELNGPAYDQQWTNIDTEDILERSDEWKDRFESAFNKEVGSDIIFKVEEKVIYAHRAIVSIQCSYLEAMLNSNWTETFDRTITINDCTYATYLRFLRYLYTGKLEISSQEGNLELLSLAHEYVEKTLLDKCEKMAIKGLTVENAFTTYKFANLLELQDLRNATKLFIGKNLEEVFCSEDMSLQEKDALVRTLRDMVCSGNILGNLEKK